MKPMSEPRAGDDVSGEALTVGSLFSGIGGLDLGLERAGMRVAWQAEIDPYCSRVLDRHWPDVPNFGDVTSIEWSSEHRVDLICGGYPCQPFSFAGRRAGTGDARHLWPHFARALRVLRPRWALLENVPGHLSLGFDAVLADLAALGFDAEWDLLPAAAVGAPHLRYRLFVVAHAKRDAVRLEPVAVADADRGRLEVGPQLDGEPFFSPADRGSRRGHADGRRDEMADAAGEGQSIFQGRTARAELARLRASRGAGWWSVEPGVGRVADGVPSRVDRLRGLGNAVVPQVAEYVGRQIIKAAAWDGAPMSEPRAGSEPVRVNPVDDPNFYCHGQRCLDAGCSPLRCVVGELDGDVAAVLSVIFPDGFPAFEWAHESTPTEAEMVALAEQIAAAVRAAS